MADGSIRVLVTLGGKVKERIGAVFAVSIGRTLFNSIKASSVISKACAGRTVFEETTLATVHLDHFRLLGQGELKEENSEGQRKG